MRFFLLSFLCVSTLFPAEERQLALALQAQSDFDRVESALQPQVQQTSACIQSQAAVIPIAPKSELSLLYFRKGYCSLVGATLTGRPADFPDAAAAFDKSIEAWPSALGPNPANTLPPTVSSGLRILAIIAKLEANPETPPSLKGELSTAVEKPVCPSSVMSPELCNSLVAVGRQWLGWLALQRGDLYEASKVLAPAPQSPWALWVAGRQAAHDRDYQQASARYAEAVKLWTEGSNAAFSHRLEPQPEMSRVWMELGGMQILAGHPSDAITSLDAAIKADSNLARAMYYRARAEELSGRDEAALADYNLASRTAFANAKDLVSGEAHLYRGIAFYRRKDYAHAEAEFASALNFGLPKELENDAQAWRHMAALAGGACGPSRQMLEESLATSSPYFPKQEARESAAACPLSDMRASGAAQ